MAKKKKSSHKNHNVLIPGENKLYNYALIILFSVFIFLFTSFKISGDDDIFWHLATGKYIFETTHIPSQDIFSFTTEGEQWVNVEWGWGLLTFLLFKIGGYAAISIFRSLIFLSMFFILFLILRNFKAGYSLIFLFFIIIAFGIMDRLAPRPHIISYLFLSLLLYIIISFKYFDRNNFKILYFIPFIFLLWANFHLGLMAGLFLLGIFLVSEIIIFLNQKNFSTREIIPLSKKDLIRLATVFFISGIMIFINPFTYLPFYELFLKSDFNSLKTLNEWKSPFDAMFSGRLVILIYKFFLFGGILILYYAFRKKDIFPALVYICFAIYSLNAVRFTVDFMIVTSIFLIVSVSYIIQNLKSQSIKSFFSESAFPKIIISGVLIFFIVSIPGDNLYLGYMKYFRHTGFGVDNEFMPVQLFDFMKENNLSSIAEKPFNHYGTGGYLIWNFPGKKNFIDSRYLNANIFNEYQNILFKKSGFEDKIKNYDFDYFIYYSPDLVNNQSEMEKTVLSFLSKHPDNWKLVFWDDKSFLFLKNIPKFKDVIDKYEYKYITPYNFYYQKKIIDNAVGDDGKRVKKELNRKLSEENILELNNGNFIRIINDSYSNKLMNIKE